MEQCIANDNAHVIWVLRHNLLQVGEESPTAFARRVEELDDSDGSVYRPKSRGIKTHQCACRLRLSGRRSCLGSLPLRLVAHYCSSKAENCHDTNGQDDGTSIHTRVLR